MTALAYSYGKAFLCKFLWEIDLMWSKQLLHCYNCYTIANIANITNITNIEKTSQTLKNITNIEYIEYIVNIATVTLREASASPPRCRNSG